MLYGWNEPQHLPHWRKSSWSFSNGNCLEAASVRGQILVRDSRNPGMAALAISPNEWLRFTLAIKDGRI